MRAIRVTQYGAPEVLELVELPAPTPAAGQLTIDVTHAAVGLIDVLIRRGDFADYGLSMQPTYTPGIEVTGTIRELGEGVSSFAVGDRVATLSISTGGGYAEVVAVDAAVTFQLPDGVDPVQAVAALPNATTANIALTHAAVIPQGGKVLVLGATGALASVFPSIARRLGASEVVGTVRSADRIAEAEQLGYDRVVLSGDSLEALEGEQFDVIVDPIGGALRGPATKLLAQMGRLIAVGSADSSGHSVDTNELWFTNRGIVGFAVGQYLAEDTSPAAPAAAAALEAIADSSIALPVEIFPLERAAEAHARLEAGGVVGRLVLAI